MKNIWGRLFYIMLCIMLITGRTGDIVKAEQVGEQWGNLYWSLDNGALIITGEGNMDAGDFDPGEIIGYPWECFIEDIYEVVINKGVTNIGAYAFRNCEHLTYVDIPDSVVSIGDFAFYGSGVESIIIPDSVTSIGDSAFEVCANLISVDIPNSVTHIGNRTFYASGLRSLVIPESVTSIGDYAFGYCNVRGTINIPDSVTYIGENAFFFFNEEHSFDISSNHPYLEKIDGVLFSKPDKRLIHYPRKAKAKSYVIPEGTAIIGGSAFANCGLNSITIPETVQSIGEEAFLECPITSITIPNSVTQIDEGAFKGCASLISVTIPNGVTRIEDGTFENCHSLKTVTIPDSVTYIGNGAFFWCISLKSIMLPENIKKIEWGTFYGCKALHSIDIPDSVTHIEDKAFAGCSKVLKLTVGQGSYAQNYCKREGIQFTIRKDPIPKEKAEFSVGEKNGTKVVSAGKNLQIISTFENSDLINKNDKNDSITWSVVNAETGEEVSAATIDIKGMLKIDKNLDEPVQLLIKGISTFFGTEATTIVTAIPIAKKVTVEPAELFFFIGAEDVQQVRASLEPDTVPLINLTWTPAVKDIIAITAVEDGVVCIRPMKVGKTDITVKENGGKSAKLTVNVVEPVKNVELKANGEAKAGGKVTMVATLLPKNAGNKVVHWSIDVGKDVATINDKGQLTIAKGVPSGTKIMVTCTAVGAQVPVIGNMEIEIP